MVSFPHQLAHVPRAPSLVFLVEEALGHSHGRVAVDVFVLLALLSGVVLYGPVLVAEARGQACARLGLATPLGRATAEQLAGGLFGGRAFIAFCSCGGTLDGRGIGDRHCQAGAEAPPPIDGG